MGSRKPLDVAAIATQLGRAEPFARADQATRLTLVNASTKRGYSRREYVWRQGAQAESIAFVLGGRLDVVRTTNEGSRVFLRAYLPGDVLGLSTIGGCAHTADVVAGEDTELLLIPHNALRSNVDILLGALAFMGELLGRLSDELVERSLVVEERLRRVLKREAKRKRAEVAFTHQDLADQIHASREEVSRSLKNFERQGAIVLKRGRLELVALEKLDVVPRTVPPTTGATRSRSPRSA